MAADVGLAIQTGVVGSPIEDRQIEAPFDLYDTVFAVERIESTAAPRAAGR